MDANSQESRSILLKLQDRLTDDDRRRLHFFFGNDVPRRIRDDPSLGGTLSLMESLFDQDKINEQDFTFLIKAFDEIKCQDAANLLRRYMKRLQQSEGKTDLSSLTDILPVSSAHHTSDEVDKFNVFQMHEFNSVGGITETLEKTPKTTVVLSETITNHLTSKKFSKFQQIIKRFLPFFTIFLLIALSIIIGFFIEQNRRIQHIIEESKTKDLLIQTYHYERNESSVKITKLTNHLEEISRDSNISLIRAGKKYGGTGGGFFDDSMIKNFSCSFYIRGMVASKNELVMDWVKFLYSPNDQPNYITEATLIGQQKQGDLEDTFILDPDERVNKVQLKLQTIDLIVGGVRTPRNIIRAVRFFTTKGRASQLIDDDKGEIVTEQFDGYTLGYARGRKGLLIDGLQFIWYRTIFN